MTGSAPRISAVIPAYNPGPVVVEAIESVLSQEVGTEVIVVDDGSTDGTAELVRGRYGQRVRILTQPNQGPGRARNRGLEAARGEYIQFLDADDLILPGKLARQAALLDDTPDAVLAYSDFVFRTEPGGETRPSPFVERYLTGDAWPELLAGNFIVTHAALVRREAALAAGGFSESLPTCEDYDLWLRLAATGRPFLYSGEASAVYRVSPGSLTSRWAVVFDTTLQVLDRARSYRPLTREEAAVVARRRRVLRAAAAAARALEALGIRRLPASLYTLGPAIRRLRRLLRPT